MEDAAELTALDTSVATSPGIVVMGVTPSVLLAAKLMPTGSVPFSPLALMKPNAVTCLQGNERQCCTPTLASNQEGH